MARPGVQLTKLFQVNARWVEDSSPSHPIIMDIPRYPTETRITLPHLLGRPVQVVEAKY
jgi:hypothetical protein